MLWGFHSHPWSRLCTLMGPVPSPGWGCRGKSAWRPLMQSWKVEAQARAPGPDVPLTLVFDAH